MTTAGQADVVLALDVADMAGALGTGSGPEYSPRQFVNPNAKVTAGFQPTMPTYQGLVSEQGLLELIEYVKSLGTHAQSPSPRPDGAGPASGENTPSSGGDPQRQP